ncbi:MAG: hypothetical protein CMM07_12490 [Rhodopirellula sp.]|nr:hypothetical protein [Rhodopirellula sp.]
MNFSIVVTEHATTRDLCARTSVLGQTTIARNSWAVAQRMKRRSTPKSFLVDSKKARSEFGCFFRSKNLTWPEILKFTKLSGLCSRGSGLFDGDSHEVKSIEID